MKIDTSSPVMVTGSTGYVGGVLVKELLQAGLTIHCPVRDPTDGSKLQHLKDLESQLAGSLVFFQADLMEEWSYLESIKGCSVVFHVASPFLTSVPKGRAQALLFDPAIKGTENVLMSAMDKSLSSCVKRVVLTSSYSAIAVDGRDTQDVFSKTGKVCNEETWNASSSRSYNPYACSKLLAERTAWKLVEDHKDECHYELVVCNPSFVIGPGVKVHSSSESYVFVKSLGDGTLKYKSPKISMPVVDVRDVAKGHMNAAFGPSEKIAGQRFILSCTNTDVLEMSLAIAEKYPNSRLPKRALPKWLAWLLAPYLGITRKLVSRSVNVPHELDQSKSIRDLGMGEYRPLTTTVQDMFQQCIETGFIPYPGVPESGK